MKIGDLIKIKKYTLLWSFPYIQYSYSSKMIYKDKIGIFIDELKGFSYDCIVLVDFKFFTITTERLELLDI